MVAEMGTLNITANEAQSSSELEVWSITARPKSPENMERQNNMWKMSGILKRFSSVIGL